LTKAEVVAGSADKKYQGSLRFGDIANCPGSSVCVPIAGRRPCSTPNAITVCGFIHHGKTLPQTTGELARCFLDANSCEVR